MEFLIWHCQQEENNIYLHFPILSDNSRETKKTLMNSQIHEQIGKAAKKLMWKEPFYGLFLISLNKEITHQVPTAGVGKQGINVKLYVNPDFWASLSEIKQMGLLKHELLHIAFEHVLQRESYSDHRLANVAMDIEINQYITSDMLPDGALLPNSFPELDLPLRAGTREYYKLLEQQKGKNKHLDALLNQDIHMTWDEFTKGMSEAEKDLVKRQLEYQIKEIVENGLKDRGLVPGELQAKINEIYTVKEPTFNWKAFLRRYINGSNKYYTRKTRRKQSKRFSGNPGLRIISKPRILVAIDTSGSVSDKELVEFFSEIYHVYKTGVAVTIIECDAALHEPYEYKGIFPGKVHGRGGTSFQPVIDYYDAHRKNFSTCIYFTDGECSAPSRPRNAMLWVISSRGRKTEGLPWFTIQIPAETTEK
jgi:predicted metal-dependent peptidase